MTMPNIIERALELARSGSYNRKSDIAKRLNQEGYGQVNQYLDATGFSRMLRAEIVKGRQNANAVSAVSVAANHISQRK